jgi:hypothetical protein
MPPRRPRVDRRQIVNDECHLPITGRNIAVFACAPQVDSTDIEVSSVEVPYFTMRNLKKPRFYELLA